MAKNNKADMSCARVKKYTASDVSKAERHNERKNETYENKNLALSSILCDLATNFLPAENSAIVGVRRVTPIR